MDPSSHMKGHRIQVIVLLLTGALILPFLGLWETNINAAPVSGASFVLTLRDNLLSARIETVSLKEVLERLSRLTNIEVSLEKSVGEETVSAEFKNLPLEDGIRRILQGKSYALTYAQTSFSKGHKPLPKVVGIRVVPKGTGPNTAQGNTDSAILHFGGNEPDGQRNAEQEQAREALVAADAKARLDALAALKDGTEENKEEALQSVVEGLKDEDASVREAAIDVLKEGDGPLPLEPLSEMAMKDSDPFNRMDALTLLAVRNGQAAMEPIEQALNDPDPGVSKIAQTLLENLKKDHQ